MQPGREVRVERNAGRATRSNVIDYSNKDMYVNSHMGGAYSAQHAAWPTGATQGEGWDCPAPLMKVPKPLTITGDTYGTQPMGATQGEGWGHPRPPVMGNYSACTNVNVDSDWYQGEEWANPRPPMTVNGIAHTNTHALHIGYADVDGGGVLQDDHKS